jgi:hypothetical protein
MELENELMLQVNVEAIVVKQGLVQFNEYDNLKQQALLLAEKIAEVEVTEDNVKHSKKLLAAVNKRLKELEDKRISIKKHMLEPYQEFETQVKDIVGIVKEADAKVREQVKYLEEFERLEKEEAVKTIFEKRLQMYNFKNLFSFDDFVKPKHLNKTATIAAVEAEMVNWLEKIEQDLRVIETMADAEAILNAYCDCLDLATAINKVNKEKEQLERIKLAKAIKENTTIQKVYVVHLYDKKDLKLVEMFMKEANVKYKLEGEM